jgi:isoleucyl-tRNA synthetase
VLPYCWNDETPLSNHELRMDDEVYQNRQDPAVTVGCRLETGELALIWTTTPWTLPSNQAIAVGVDIDYVVVQGTPEHGGEERYLIAEALLPRYTRELGEDAADRIVQRLKGSELLGRRYTPPFSYFLDSPNAHVVLAGDHVTTEDGTGLVHMAPAFGEEDKIVTDAAGITPVVPVDAAGRFTSEVPDYAALQVFDANGFIIDDLKATTRGTPSGSVTPGTVLLRQESYDHPYPHCWRCKNPLIYKAVSSWFVEVTKLRDRMGELNRQITWTPATYDDGRASNHWPRAPNRAALASTDARTASRPRTTRFGSPLDPEVAIRRGSGLLDPSQVLSWAIASTGSSEGRR